MNYEILFQGDLQEDERLQRDFRVLLATRAGSQPVDRDLGIDWSCLDGRRRLPRSCSGWRWR